MGVRWKHITPFKCHVKTWKNTLFQISVNTTSQTWSVRQLAKTFLPLSRDYFSIPPILKGTYSSHTRVCRRYLQHTQYATVDWVCLSHLIYDSNDWVVLNQLRHTEYATNICGIHEYDLSISLWEWEQWNEDVFFLVWIKIMVCKVFQWNQLL